MKKFIRTTVFAALTVTSTWLMPVAQADNAFTAEYSTESDKQYVEDDMADAFEYLNAQPFSAEPDNQYIEDDMVDSYVYLNSQPRAGYSYSPYNQ